MNELQGAIGRRKSCVSGYEQKARSPLDNDNKLQGLEATLDRRVVLSPPDYQREAARLEVVMCTEAKTGLRVRDTQNRWTRIRFEKTKPEDSMDVRTPHF